MKGNQELIELDRWEEIARGMKPLPELKRTRKSQVVFESGCAKAEVEIVEWEEKGDGTQIEPFVLIQLEWLVEDTEMSCVWAWWTDHYWSVIANELPGFLARYCPAPEEVWETLLAAVSDEQSSGREDREVGE